MSAKFFTDKKISICAVCISIISIAITCVFSIRQCNFENRLYKLHIDPTLDYYLIRSIDKKSLEFHLKNNSPIPVVSLSVSRRGYVFSKKLKKYISGIPSMGSILDSPGENWIFRNKVVPNESVGKKDYLILDQLVLHPKDTVVTVIFEITYFRDSDMEQFVDKAIFILDGETIYSYKKALKQDFLKEPIEQLPAFEERIKLGISAIDSRRSDGSKLYQKAE